VKVREFTPDTSSLKYDFSTEGRALLVTLDQAVWDVDTIREHQLADKTLGPIVKQFDTKQKVKGYALKSKVLMKWVRDPLTRLKKPVVALPKSLVKPVLDLTHGRYGGMHTGCRKLQMYLKMFYHWPKLEADCLEYVSKCPTCQYNSPYAARIVNDTEPRRSWRRFDLVFIDTITSLPRSRNGNKYIIVMVEAFTRYAVTVAVPNKEAETVANAYLTRWVNYFGPAKYLNSDRGETNADFVKNVCQILGTVKSASPIYRPQAEGCVEGLNRVIMNLLRHELAGADESYWDVYLGLVTLTYNSSPHTKTGYSPFMMMFGEELGNVVPVVDIQHPMLTDEYLKHIRQAQELHWNAVSEMQKAELAKRKDAACVSHKFNAGDFVLVRKKSGNPRGENKLGAGTNRWRGPYRVLKTYPGCLVVMSYQVGTSLAGKKGEESDMNPDLNVKGGMSRLQQDVVPVSDCKPYHGEIPPVPVINVKRARELLRELGVDTKLMDGPEGNAKYPAARDLGPENITDEMLALAEANSRMECPEDVTVAEQEVQRPRGRPRKASPHAHAGACDKQGNSERMAVSRQKVVKLPLGEGEAKPLGRTRSATRLLDK
jgi:hypothetical protein